MIQNSNFDSDDVRKELRAFLRLVFFYALLAGVVLAIVRIGVLSLDLSGVPKWAGSAALTGLTFMIATAAVNCGWRLLRALRLGRSGKIDADVGALTFVFWLFSTSMFWVNLPWIPQFVLDSSVLDALLLGCAFTCAAYLTFGLFTV